MVLVIFKEALSKKDVHALRCRVSSTDLVISPISIQKEFGFDEKKWINIKKFINPGSIYEASKLMEELSKVELLPEIPVAKTHEYKEYELWWIKYNSIFINNALPYTQYKKLLVFLSDFNEVVLYQPPHSDVFSIFFQGQQNTKLTLTRPRKISFYSLISPGIMIQILLTIALFPVVILQRKKILLFTSDLFDGDRDYDFRLKYIYEKLRVLKVPFVEFVRSLESWGVVSKHAIKRKRPVVYIHALKYVARYLSILFCSNKRLGKKFNFPKKSTFKSLEERFIFSLAKKSVGSIADDIWEIRLTKVVLKFIGVKTAFVPAGCDRNMHILLACKLLKIPTVGILHGMASKYYNTYDFLPGYRGKKSISVDKYGVWSQWWKEYYLKNSKIFTKEQLYVSGPMRPLQEKQSKVVTKSESSCIKVLFISEQLAVPEEVLPYLKFLLERDDISLFISFRPYKDGFEDWLKKNHPDLLSNINRGHIIRGNIAHALSLCDVAVGTHSTAVLESLLHNKPFVFFETKKWGDYYDFEHNHFDYTFFSKTPEKLLEHIIKNSKVSNEVLQNVREKFFGDFRKNGSEWVVGELVKNIS